MSNEEYLQGRRAGVTGTYGNKHDGVAEKTVVTAGSSNGGGEPEVAGKASSIYGRAVSNGGGRDSGGDEALRRR